MKTSIWYKSINLLFGLLIMVGCSHDEDIYVNENVSGNHTLRAVIEHEADARTVIDDAYNVLWAKEDCIGVFGNKQSDNAPFVVSSLDTETFEADFTGTLQDAEEPLFAYYPYSEGADFVGNTLSVTLPDEYELTNESNLPMLGMPDGENVLRFKHLMGLMRITVKNVPTGKSQLVVESEGENAPALSGEATVSDVFAEDAVLNLDNAGSRTITFNVEAAEPEDVIFYVPLPVGTYPRLKVSLNHESSVYFAKTMSNRTIRRAVVLNMPAIEIQPSNILVSTHFVPIHEHQPTVVSSDMESGIFELDFANGMPALEEGSIISLDLGTMNVFRRITSLSVSGSKVVVDSEPACLNDVIHKGTFTLSTESYTGTRSIGETPTFYPEEIRYYDENGQLQRVPYNRTRAIDDTANMMIGTKFEPSNKDIKKTEHAHLYWEKYSMEISANLRLHCSFDEVEDLTYENYKRGELEIYEASVTGSFNSDFKIRLDANNDILLSEDEIVLVKNILKPKYLCFKIKDNPVLKDVPILVAVDTHLMTDYEIEASGSFCAYAGCKTDASVTSGISWNKNSGSKPIFDRSFNHEPYTPTITGYGSVNGKISVYPRISIGLFDASKFSLYVDLKPYLREEAEIGLYDELGTSDADYYGSLFKTYWGMDFNAGANLHFLGVSKNISLPDQINLGEQQLYEAPKLIEFHDSSTKDIIPDVPVTASFKVSGYNHLHDLYVDVSTPYVVKFTTNCGELTQDFVSVNETTSTATVEWTPGECDEEPYLKATMHDGLGNEITSDYWYPQYKVVVTTGDATDITSNEALCHGSVGAIEEDFPGYSYGICYSTSSDPTSDQAAIHVAGSSIENGAYSVFLSGLEAEKTYYYCAYMEWDERYYYGEVKSFNTDEPSVTRGTAIDLGLSVKWASHNVGAKRPEDSGEYFSWGETETKDNFHSSTYKYYFKGQVVHPGAAYSSYVYLGEEISGTEYDVAHVKWGRGWRMPTKAEFMELNEKCTFEWVTINGMSGHYITGPNGKSIFLPACGGFGPDLFSFNVQVLYWTGTQLKGVEGHPMPFAMTWYGTDENSPWGGKGVTYKYRYEGYPIRPVCE